MLSFVLGQKFYPEESDKEVTAFSRLSCGDEYPQKICELITSENEKNGEHMLPKNPDDIEKNNMILYTDSAGKVEELIGYMGLTQVQEGENTIYEAGSLVVSDDYLGQKMGKNITHDLFEKYSNKPLFMITNVDAVKKIATGIDLLVEVKKTDCPTKLLQAIEEEGALLDNDCIYTNKTLSKLYSNN